MSMDTKLSKAQLHKIIQSGQFLGALLGTVTGLLMKTVVPLGNKFLAPLATMALAFAKRGSYSKKNAWRKVLKNRKWMNLVISNEIIDNVVTIMNY